MKIDILTSQHLDDLKTEIINEMKNLIDSKETEQEWLKSREAKKILGCSEGTLNNLRISGMLPYSKICGTIYIRKSDLQRLFEQNINA
jgi:hypothetical protein